MGQREQSSWLAQCCAVGDARRTLSQKKNLRWRNPRPCTYPALLRMRSARITARAQGLTLVHFSAQLEPCLTHPTHP